MEIQWAIITVLGTTASIGGVLFFIFNGTKKMINETHSHIIEMRKMMQQNHKDAIKIIQQNNKIMQQNHKETIKIMQQNHKETIEIMQQNHKMMQQNHKETIKMIQQNHRDTIEMMAKIVDLINVRLPPKRIKKDKS